MKSIEWIERAKKAGNLTSDRQIAQALGITSATLSYHRSGRNKTLSDENCVVIAEICKVDPAIVIADQLAERATTPAVRKIYQRLGKLATAAGSGVAAGVLATICLALPNKSLASQLDKAMRIDHSVYYVK